eukprot:1700099-Amphidinium_carterae.2
MPSAFLQVIKELSVNVATKCPPEHSSRLGVGRPTLCHCDGTRVFRVGKKLGCLQTKKKSGCSQTCVKSASLEVKAEHVNYVACSELSLVLRWLITHTSSLNAFKDREGVKMLKNVGKQSGCSRAKLLFVFVSYSDREGVKTVATGRWGPCFCMKDANTEDISVLFYQTLEWIQEALGTMKMWHAQIPSARQNRHEHALQSVCSLYYMVSDSSIKMAQEFASVCVWGPHSTQCIHWRPELHSSK